MTITFFKHESYLVQKFSLSRQATKARAGPSSGTALTYWIHENIRLRLCFQYYTTFIMATSD